MPSGAGAQEGFVVVLSPDPTDRYRPAVVSVSGESVLANIDSITSPALSPDRTRVAFSGALGNGSLGLYALFVVNVDGSNLTQLTDGTYGEFDPAWSPNGQSIVISQNTSGGILKSNCCRLARVDVDTGQVTALTQSIGATRPSYSPDGSSIVFNITPGVWRMPAGGGAATSVAASGYDPVVSPDGSRVAYLVDVSGGTQLRTSPIGGGSSQTVYSTSGELESPQWIGQRIYFFEHSGLGYDGRKSVRMRSVNANGSAARTDRTFNSHHVGMSFYPGNDEMFFYRTDGEFRYYNISPNADLGTPIQGGSGYSTGWSSISSIDLNGDGSDEMLFYRATSGTFKYYDMKTNATLGPLIRSGDGYSTGWNSITSIDLDGDGQDEIFFYRTTGSFRFYDIKSNGDLGSPLQGGNGFSSGWSSISAIDLDGDGADEMFFYRASDGVFKYYDVRSDGRLGALILSGSGYSTGWSSITAVDLDGDGQDEIFFYRSDGAFRFYDIGPNANLGSPIQAGSGFTTGWSWVTAVDVDG